MRTNNSNTGGKKRLQRKKYVLIYQPFPFSFYCPPFLFLSTRPPSHFASAYLSISHFSQSKISLLTSPLTLRLYLGPFISVIPFSTIALCQSISPGRSPVSTLAWFSSLSTLSASDWNKKNRMFSLSFIFSLRHQNRIQRIHKYIFARKKKEAFILSQKKVQCSSCHLWSCTDCCWQVKPQWQKSQLSICDKTDNHWFTEINIAVVTSSVQYVLMGNVGTNGEAVWRVGCTDC